MANAHGVVVVMFDVAHLMTMRRGLSGERREQHGETSDSKKTDESFGNGVHSIGLVRDDSGMQ
ncbi:hypothetical protein [Paraburkholderia acidisoli]|uniref:Uncharacterized protein n=1 Tax=Paraburkholderia acidisoli TaxID=2571748 RepID=A0A7Z2JHG8_9BURK|nr:hypothetical protein [Paraburkholderia acidisoli]QGZ63260.1 hypothetical protein FAZ98_15765 [Paraburkholderia acidisoli]